MHLLTGRWQLSATRLALLLALFFTLLNVRRRNHLHFLAEMFALPPAPRGAIFCTGANVFDGALRLKNHQSGTPDYPRKWRPC